MTGEVELLSVRQAAQRLGVDTAEMVAYILDYEMPVTKDSRGLSALRSDVLDDFMRQRTRPLEYGDP